MNNSVPLWAYFVTTAVALLGPLLASWVANRRAVQAAREQRQHDRAMFLLDQKHKLYSDTLDVFGRAAFEMIESDETRHAAVTQLMATVTRLQMHGSPDVLSEATIVRNLMGELYSAITDEAIPENTIKQRRLGSMVVPALDKLGAMIREDLKREQQPSTDKSGSGRKLGRRTA